MTNDHEQRRYARQILFGPLTAAVPSSLSTSIAWSNSSMIRAHPWVRIEHAAAADRELVCLGHMLDPKAPTLDNAQVVKDLCEQATSFTQFERASASLGGRWAALLRIRDEARLYPDAAGMRSIFHARLDNGAVVAASQPSLLSSAYGLMRDDEIDHTFGDHRHFANSWPCELTPYPGVRQLLPNHFLDLNNGEVRRFWPTTTIVPIDVDLAVESIAAQLSGFITAILNRGRAALAMTGGYDSRTLFAAAGAARAALKLFHVTRAHSPLYDTLIPRRLASRFGGTFLELAPHPCPAPLRRIMRENVARMWSDPGDYILNTFGMLDSDFIIFGWISEIGRCFYYPDGQHPERVDGAVLARVAHFVDHPMAIAAFERWLADTPAGTSPALLDLFYWEHRAGNWASLLATACDTFCEPIAPYNCHALLQTALAVPVSFRRSPYELHRRICDFATPGTLDVPFNFSLRDTIRDRALSLLPWRAREWLQKATAPLGEVD